MWKSFLLYTNPDMKYTRMYISLLRRLRIGNAVMSMFVKCIDVYCIAIGISVDTEMFHSI